ncbi:hypothetical protein D3C87_653850 [compost metagenome]
MGSRAVAGSESAGENEDGGYQRDGGSGANGGGKLADKAVDDVERILHAHTGDRRIGVGDSAQYAAFVGGGCGGVGERCQPRMRRAAEGVR